MPTHERRRLPRLGPAIALALSAAGAARGEDRDQLLAPPALTRPSTVSGPRFAAAGHIDSDGIADLAVASSGVLDLFITAGTAEYRDPIRIGIPPGAPSEVTIADFDADGFNDLFFLLSGEARVLPGGGDGVFTIGTATTIGDEAALATVGLLDGDPFPDVAVVSSSFFVPFLGDGSGGFLPGTPIPLDAGTIARLSLGDVDGDGAVDAIVSNSTLSRIDVLLGDGMGGFGAPSPLPTPMAPDQVLVHDLDGDGDGDLVVDALVATPLFLYENLGALGFSLLATLHSGGGAGLALGVLDHDDDGAPDVAVLTPSTVRVFHTDGALGLVPPAVDIPAPVEGGPASFFADLDSDGTIDAVSASATWGVIPLVGNPKRSARTVVPRSYESGPSPRDAALADLDGDGRLDLLVLDRGPDSGNGTVTVFRADRIGGFGVFGAFNAGARPAAMAAADFDRDGRMDVAVGKEAGNELFLLRGDGTGRLFFAAAFSFFGGVESLKTLDANEDGRADLVAMTTKGVSLRLGDGAGGFATEVLFDPAFDVRAFEGFGIDTADMDGDGHVDLVYAIDHTATGNQLTVRFGDGTGAFPRLFRLAGAADEPFAVGDLDGNGLPDVVSGTRAFPGHGGTGVGTPVDLSAALARANVVPARVAIGDVDADGIGDLVTAGDRDGATAPFITVLPGGRSFAFGLPRSFAAFTRPSDLRLGDADGDCHADVVVIASPGVTILKNQSLDHLAARAGNVNAAAGPVADVLLVNGAAGEGAARSVGLGPSDPFELRMLAPPSLATAKFAAWVWLGIPDGGTVQDLPFGLGRIAMPPPLTPSCRPRPRHIFNNLGAPALLGAPTRPSTPAPSVLVSAAGGVGRSVDAYVQGVIRDRAAPNGQFAVTNGIELRVR